MKIIRKVFVFSLLGTLSLAPLFAKGSGDQGGAQNSAAPYTVTVAGSTSVNPLMELLTAEYRKTHSNVSFNISATGSGDGIKAVPAATAEIGMSSRELSAAEKGTGIDEHLIAIDGIAVVVNSANPLSNLTVDQIRNIYTGAVSDWSQVGGRAGRIAVVSREPGSGTRSAFEELVRFQDQLVRGAVEFDGTGAVIAEISRNADAIGYISLGSVSSAVKTLSVDGVAASTANVINGSYKIFRPFLLLTKRGGNLNGETAAFLDWILTPAGQNIVKTSWIAVK
ncbi:MAG: phosphate ABC transporter substrate-binding protein [Treponema sp.]|jgi:phosphate transport system substrate-binding protein|nr:phosphate ABC transporter substrate-binding protein [Treponema sp.]